MPCKHAGHSREMPGEGSPNWKGGPPEWICAVCKTPYKRAMKVGEKSVYCSRACSGIGRGEEKRRKTPPEIRIPLAKVRRWLRNSFEYREWRVAVYTRDGHACVKCGTTERLTAHHVKQIVTHPELAFDVENGLTVCDSCHKGIHAIEGTAQGTARLVEWMTAQGWNIDTGERPLYPHTCAWCGRGYQSILPKRKFCSSICGSRWWNEENRNRNRRPTTPSLPLPLAPNP